MAAIQAGGLTTLEQRRRRHSPHPYVPGPPRHAKDGRLVRTCATCGSSIIGTAARSHGLVDAKGATRAGGSKTPRGRVLGTPVPLSAFVRDRVREDVAPALTGRPRTAAAP